MKTPAKSSGAFTLVELLVVVAMLGVFVVMLAPALASTKDHAQRAACANNLRQLGLGASIYAEHYGGAYPITQAGNNSVNVVRGGYYTRWIFYDGSRSGFHLSQTWDAGTDFVFGLDYMAPDTWNTDGTINAGSINFAHTQAQGWNVLFSDNSVEFKRTDKRVRNTVLLNNAAFAIGTGNGYDIHGIDLLCGNIFEK